MVITVFLELFFGRLALLSWLLLLVLSVLRLVLGSILVIIVIVIVSVVLVISHLPLLFVSRLFISLVVCWLLVVSLDIFLESTLVMCHLLSVLLVVSNIAKLFVQFRKFIILLVNIDSFLFGVMNFFVLLFFVLFSCQSLSLFCLLLVLSSPWCLRKLFIQFRWLFIIDFRTSFLIGIFSFPINLVLLLLFFKMISFFILFTFFGMNFFIMVFLPFFKGPVSKVS